MCERRFRLSIPTYDIFHIPKRFCNRVTWGMLRCSARISAQSRSHCISDQVNASFLSIATHSFRLKAVGIIANREQFRGILLPVEHFTSVKPNTHEKNIPKNNPGRRIEHDGLRCERPNQRLA